MPAAASPPSRRRCRSLAGPHRGAPRMGARDVSAVGLVPPPYGRDLERCALLCESVDRYVTSFATHYLIVPDDELALFARFNTATREVLPVSQLLPSWLKPLPRFIRRK